MTCNIILDLSMIYTLPYKRRCRYYCCKMETRRDIYEKCELLYIFSFTSILILSSIDFRNTAFRIMKKKLSLNLQTILCLDFDRSKRLKVKVSQINVGHELQNFRPYSSLKTRVLLATKHFILILF